jgi:membrane protein DedA with SNARE-associated domain
VGLDVLPVGAGDAVLATVLLVRSGSSPPASAGWWSGGHPCEIPTPGAPAAGRFGHSGDVAEWIFGIIDSLGAVGVGLLILLENVIPPIPSEVILPLAGFRASTGAFNVVAVWLAATAGALSARSILYGLGAWLGYERLHRLAGHRWFILASQKDIDRGDELFDTHGGKIVLLARCVPLVRSIVSVPAGLSGMPVLRFSVFTAIGSGIWNAVFIALGWTSGRTGTRSSSTWARSATSSSACSWSGSSCSSCAAAGRSPSAGTAPRGKQVLALGATGGSSFRADGTRGADV